MPPGFSALSVGELRCKGMAEAGIAARERLGAHAERLWSHMDLDVPGEEVFPATDYPVPGGLDWTGFDALVWPLERSPRLAGIGIACHNPEKDPEGWHGRTLVTHLATLIGPEGPPS